MISDLGSAPRRLGNSHLWAFLVCTTYGRRLGRQEAIALTSSIVTVQVKGLCKRGTRQLSPHVQRQTGYGLGGGVAARLSTVICLAWARGNWP